MSIITIIATIGLIIGIVLLFNQYSFYELGDKRYSKFKADCYLGLIAINASTLLLPYII